MGRALDELRDANEQALKIVTDAGLTVNHGEQPTREQVALAALHGREDAALAVVLLMRVLTRMDESSPAMMWRRLGVVCWWAGVLLAIPTFGIATLLIFWPLSYVLTGSFWRRPRM